MALLLCNAEAIDSLFCFLYFLRLSCDHLVRYSEVLSSPAAAMMLQLISCEMSSKFVPGSLGNCEMSPRC